MEFRIRADRRGQAHALFATMLAQTSTFAGAERIEWIQDREDPEAWTIYEEWASPEAELAYRGFRAAEGAVPELAEVLAAAPSLRRFDLLAGS
ncbi:MAG: antibiotic biosynthesis monooxygenase family protein [Microbacterium sp.]